MKIAKSLNISKQPLTIGIKLIAKNYSMDTRKGSVVGFLIMNDVERV